MDFVGLKSSDIMKVLGNKDSFELFDIIVEKVNIDSRVLQSTSKLSKKHSKTNGLWLGEKKI